MLYPSMRGKQSARISIPLLNGGLNVSRQATEIYDNQLTECTNMWFNDGTLKTRPGTKRTGGMTATRETPFKYTGVDIVYKNQKTFLFYDFSPNNALSFINENGEVLDSWFMGENWVNSETFVPHLSNSTQWVYRYYTSDDGVYNDGILYEYGKISRIKILDEPNENGNIIEREYMLNESECKTPTVLVNNEFNNDGKVNGTTFEGYNLLSRKYKVLCTTKEDTDDEHFINVFMPTKQEAGVDIIVEFDTIKWGHQKIVIKDDDTGSGNNWVGRVDAKLNGEGSIVSGYDYIEARYLNETQCFSIYASKEQGGLESIGRGSGSSNLTVTMTSKGDWYKRILPVCKNTTAVWYGGMTGGISGGSFLFMAGAEPNKLIWSDVNNPLYFPENNYIMIGESGDKITKLAKMGNVLVVFKEHSIYVVSCTENEGVTVEQLTSGAVTDVTSYAATFPTANINDDIGCDLPGTVQLCRNRLVWANSNGKVYQLVTHSMTSERNVYEVSGNIEKLLKEELKLVSEPQTSASAANWNGYYILSYGTKNVFVMNYNNYGFSNIYSYSKTEDAENRIEWYKWEFKYDVLSLVKANNNLLFVGYIWHGDHSDNIFSLLDENTTYDDTFDKQYDIPCSFSTKWFDFGMMDYYKSIEQIYLTAGSEAGENINLAFITQRGTFGERQIKPEATSSNNEGFLQTFRQLPMQKRLRHFGFKLSSSGQFVFGGFVIKFKVMGGIK